MTFDDLRRINADAAYRYTYLPDAPGIDTWRSHADDLLAGHAWQGDCDDLVSTVLDLCARRGHPLSKMWRLVVLVKGTTDGHMIGAVEDDDGKFWVVADCNFQGAIYRADLLTAHYTPVRFQRMDKVMPDNEWDKGVPWEAKP